jgi:GNAT superfamily N-acetyltransferase
VEPLHSIESCDDDGVRETLKNRIDEFNIRTMGELGYRAVTFIVRGDDGVVVAGIDGRCWGDTCFIAALWVTEELRGAGLGAALLARAETVAREHGCHQMALESHSFQAPGFYERFGYEEIGVLDDYPRGSANHFLRKPLLGGEAARSNPA